MVVLLAPVPVLVEAGRPAPHTLLGDGEETRTKRPVQPQEAAIPRCQAVVALGVAAASLQAATRMCRAQVANVAATTRLRVVPTGRLVLVVPGIVEGATPRMTEPVAWNQAQETRVGPVTRRGAASVAQGPRRLPRAEAVAGQVQRVAAAALAAAPRAATERTAGPVRVPGSLLRS